MDETDTTTMDFGRLSFGERKNKKKYVYINCKTCPGIYVKRHVSNKSKFYRRPSDSKLFEHIATIEGKEFYKKKNCTKQHKTKFGCGSPGGGCHSGFGTGPSISQFSSNRFGRLPPLGAINAPYSKGKFGIPLTPLRDISSDFSSTIPKPKFGRSRFGCPYRERFGEPYGSIWR